MEKYCETWIISLSKLERQVLSCHKNNEKNVQEKLRQTIKEESAHIIEEKKKYKV